ncbi:hypothetical protein FM105_05375 [Brevibacterium yomogidense]|uniref:Uncharacterized protein n=1 Tax=Brevibacterium yomogidense TaxID=946573 RepID=A0A1X6XA90_9MICO|nr:hypothetical protein FM105_05375 [Brevibacterium yomogidense]
MLGQLGGHVGAGSAPGVADLQDLANLGQTEPGDFAAADELQSGDGFW